MKYHGWVASAGVAVLAAAALFACNPKQSKGWQVTVYYTAVEAYHDEDPQTVYGCRKLDCERGKANLGSYPADFVQAVRDEGAGRTRAGRYLNWAEGTGFWLDSAARDTKGRPLRPFRSAAADGLADGTRVRLVGCGRLQNGSPVPVAVCRRLSQPRWEIRDAFTSGLGGPRHIDLYIGEETGPDFTSQPIFTTLRGADVRVGAK